MTAAAGWTARSGHTSVALPDGNIILVGGTASLRLNDVWRSADQGATWTQRSGWTPRSTHSSVALPDGSIVLMGGYDSSTYRRGDVWRSTDQGATWTQMTAYAGWTERNGHSSVAPPDGSIILMGGSDNGFRRDVWRSTDQGATWTQMTAAAEWSSRMYHTSVTLSDGAIVLMGGYYRSYSPVQIYIRNDVWRSNDQGATWFQMTDAPGWIKRYGHSSVVLPDDSIVLMGGGSVFGVGRNDVWRSTNQGATWTQMTANAGWAARIHHTSVALPDGSIILMGGYDGSKPLNDVWRSTDQGATWTQLAAAAEWPGREAHTTVTLPDGSIVLMGGDGGNNRLNDVWRLETAGSTGQHPTHTYTEPGTYSVALQAYNADGFSSMRKVAYITVADTEAHLLYLPLVLRNAP
jgi:hypothetical protein